MKCMQKIAITRSKCWRKGTFDFQHDLIAEKNIADEGAGSWGILDRHTRTT